MKARYTTNEGRHGNMEKPVILAQPMEHGDGFTLLGFDDWEDVNNEKLSHAVTDVQEFELSKDKAGFHNG